VERSETSTGAAINGGNVQFTRRASPIVKPTDGTAYFSPPVPLPLAPVSGRSLPSPLTRGEGATAPPPARS
jgi:hypothetical protein